MSLLFYNGGSGLSQLYNRNDQGGIKQLNNYSFGPTTWTHIFPWNEGFNTTLPLLFYDNRSGVAELYRIDQYGNLSQLSSTTYAPGWTHIVLDTFGLLFYNSTSGLAQRYSSDGQGGLNLLSSTTYAPGWTHIIYGNFTDDLSGQEALFFYNQASGLGQFYYIDRQGGINLLSSTTYAPGWTHIVPGTFGLLFYNSASGLGQFYKPDGSGGIQQLSSATYSSGWTHIVDVGVEPGSSSIDDDLLFYNGTTGLTQFYHTDRQGNISQLTSSTDTPGWTIIDWLEIEVGG